MPVSVRELTVAVESWAKVWENGLPGVPEEPVLLVMMAGMSTSALAGAESPMTVVPT